MLRLDQESSDHAGSGRALQPPNFEAYCWQTSVIQNRDKIVRLLRMFSSPRKRLRLSSDELLIFFAIGYLSANISNGAIQISPVALIDVSALLGIPKETIRRKIGRLVGLEYLSSSQRGVSIKEIKIWCEMFEGVLA